jgi:uncharacterized surface protein with fasciclin (FAS1) repeats
MLLLRMWKVWCRSESFVAFPFWTSVALLLPCRLTCMAISSLSPLPSMATNTKTKHFTHNSYVHMMDKVITPTHVSQSIYDQCRNHPDFSLLIENIDFVRLTDMVDRTLPLTMLVSPNKAWERVTFSTVDGPDIINRHIFRGLQFTDVLANLTTITAVNGAVHTIERKGPNFEYLYVGGAYIYEGDILARNGVMHRIDRVIGLEYPTVPPSTSPAPTITAEPTMYVAPTTTPVAGPVGPVAFTFPPQDAPSQEGSTPGGGNGGDKSSAALMAFSFWTGWVAPLLVGVAMALVYY